MQTKRHAKKLNKTITIAIAALFAVVVVYLLYVIVYRPYNSNTENRGSKNNSSDAGWSNNPINPEDKTKAPNTDTPATPTKTAESNKKQVEMVASADRSNGIVFIRGGINYPVTGGACFVKLSGPSGQSIKKDTAVLSNPNSADCKTISITEIDLAPGKWTFTLNYASDEYEGVSNEASFNL